MSDFFTDEQLDRVLRRQPRWDPPRHFAAAVVAQLPAGLPVTASASRPRALNVLRVAALGAGGASLTYAAGILLSLVTAALLPSARVAAIAYEMFLETATMTLIDHGGALVWVIAAVTLVSCASAMGRVREWL